MMRLSQLTLGSLHRHADGPGRKADRDRGLALGGHRHGLPPPRLLEITKRADHADELRLRLELAAIFAGLRRLQLEFLAADQFTRQGGLLVLEEREEVGAVERG